MFSVSPPIPINRTDYICEKTFQLDTIKSLYEQQPYYGVVLISARLSELWLVNDLQRKLVKRIELTVTNSHQKGGQSQGRFDRIFQNKRDRNDTVLIEELLATYYNKYLNKPNILGLIVGGNAETRTRVINDPDLSVLQDHVVCNVAYPDMNVRGLYELTASNREEYRNKSKNKVVNEIEELLATKADYLDFGIIEVITGLESFKYSKVFYNKDESCQKIVNLMSNHKETKFIETDPIWIAPYGNCIGLFKYTFLSN